MLGGVHHPTSDPIPGNPTSPHPHEMQWQLDGDAVGMVEGSPIRVCEGGGGGGEGVEPTHLLKKERKEHPYTPDRNGSDNGWVTVTCNHLTLAPNPSFLL
jgi:hypothetical protein